MIIYQNSKASFIEDVLTNNIDGIINDFFKSNIGYTTTKSEMNAWKNSLQYMDRVLNHADIPDDAGIVIEYQIPQTSKRIDFIITGEGDQNESYAVLVELKQWSEASISAKDGIVSTFLGKNNREVSHPSYQAWSYAALLEGFNEAVYTKNIQLKPCAYLHNYTPDNVIDNPFYSDYIAKAPLFLKPDALKLRSFIKSFIRYGDRKKVMLLIDGGRIRPSKSLADSLSSMLKGNDEFIMIDDQKVVFETAKQLAQRSSENKKHVLIVEGGPGTGKSVVAINLLVSLTKLGLLSQYVSKNSAPRIVYEAKLKGAFKKSEISNFFSGSGSFTSTAENIFDALIVDEAHRLNAKSGMFANLGENQIKEIIHSSKFSIFFIDENQKVALQDIGEIDEIQKWASYYNAAVTRLELNSQFRCNGSDGYLAWLDHILQIRETANTTLDKSEYEFKVFDDPEELRTAIFEKNKISNKARLVAGYCWPWKSKKDPNALDIEFEDFGFGMKWNLATDGMTWIIQPESVHEIGCIHTCQGLELDYVGVILGKDFLVRNGKIITNAAMRASDDKTVRGFKRLMKEDSEKAAAITASIIKNTYRTLMTRGMKGCYIYSVDPETRHYFERLLRH
ncbi:DNA/RNA helicase domain-containing protein [Flavobacterium alkalisoli]|uniref:DNA/RNA helicase domain-containing protein n=1 Tax=Flavobacterium alkalisoli TaxID=2602769 RepID=UPI003A8D9294